MRGATIEMDSAENVGQRLYGSGIDEKSEGGSYSRFGTLPSLHLESAFRLSAQILCSKRPVSWYLGLILVVGMFLRHFWPEAPHSNQS